MRVLERLGILSFLFGGGRIRWLLLAGVLLPAGCGSRFVSATIENTTEQQLQMVELDYPGASFGISTLAPHAVYSYRFKAIGSGPVKLSYTEAGVSHSATGPVVEDGKGGRLAVSIRTGGSVTWAPSSLSR